MHPLHIVTDSCDCILAQVKTVRTHSSYFINLVVEPMEPIHAELLRGACHSNSVEAVLTMVTLRFGRTDGCAAVLSRDGHGGALLREVAKLGKLGDNTIETLERTFWDVQQLSAAVAAALITCTPER